LKEPLKAIFPLEDK
jgi:hypothetical protein